LFKLLLLLFVAVPLIEIYLLVRIGAHIGALPTVGLVVLTALIGAFLVRIYRVSQRWRKSDNPWIKASCPPAP
jgi:UPF0716 family protein affecting phage T7 exclusion